MKFDLTSTLKNKAARGSQDSEQLLIISEHAGSEIELSDGDLQAVSGGHRHDCEPDPGYCGRRHHHHHHHHHGGDCGSSSYGYNNQGVCDSYSGGGNCDGGYGGYSGNSGNCQPACSDFVRVTIVHSSSNCGY